MKKIMLSGFLLLAGYAATAQSGSAPTAGAAVQNTTTLGDGNVLTGLVLQFDNRYEGVKGSPYFGHSWSKASVGVRNVVYENVIMKYNVFDNTLIYQNSKGGLMELDTRDVSQFVLLDSLTQQPATFKKLYLAGNFEPAMAMKFGRMVYESKKVKLVSIPQKELVKADFKGTYSSGRTADEFVSTDTYYLVIDGMQPQKVKLNKKSLVKALSNTDKIEAYLKEQKWDAGTEYGWAQTLAYYETL